MGTRWGPAASIARMRALGGRGTQRHLPYDQGLGRRTPCSSDDGAPSPSLALCTQRLARSLTEHDSPCPCLPRTRSQPAVALSAAAPCRGRHSECHARSLAECDSRRLRRLVAGLSVAAQCYGRPAECHARFLAERDSRCPRLLEKCTPSRPQHCSPMLPSPRR
eukprot:776986-Prymnesium_polylepis.1